MHCPGCGSASFKRATAHERLEIDSTEFIVELPSIQCHACHQVFVDGTSLEQFETRVAEMLAQGNYRKTALALFLRVLRVSSTELGTLLETRGATIDAWETGTEEMPTAIWRLLSAMLIAQVRNLPPGRGISELSRTRLDLPPGQQIQIR